MKKTIGLVFVIGCVFTLFQNIALANFKVTENWNENLRSQVLVECNNLTNVCIQLCNNEKSCILKNSTCKDCISTGVKMTYFFSAFGKDITSKNEEVSAYEFIDFLINEKFIAFSANSIYNQFDSAQSDALDKKFRAMCPNKYESPVAFFKIENRELDIKNARYVTCGDFVYKLEVNSSLLE